MKLKILVVLPMYGGSLPVGRFCAEALKRQGHLVEVFEAPDFHCAFTALKGIRVSSSSLEYLENSFLQVVSSAILAKVDFFQPDLVLALAQAPLSRQALKRLRADKVRTAMWFVEDFRIFGYWRAFAPYYDVFAVIQREPFFSELKAAGVDNHLYLPMAADPLYHKPLELGLVEQKKWGSDLSFMGAGYPNRRKAFKELTSYDFKIWGTEWDGDSILAPFVQMGGRRISSEECVKIFNASKINLNLHSTMDQNQLVGQGDFVNPRTFELASCAAFQLVDRRGLMDELFRDDELAFFSDMADLREKIDYYLARPEDRALMAAKARKRVQSEHTYEHRMKTLVDYAVEKLGLKKESAANPVLDELSPELRQDLESMLARLGLSPNARFEDVVHYIRQEKGRLSPLETSILFLDEWQKQYKS
ncbi:CgeB family protein [Desulfonatronovibrio hydrogenovorans]|uniref:CgeB family protein n=1 Tax=Desulfonatronovibrio hydrogenovorans TaxID=53245 RepID=UPI00054D524B|nr:glycosyltransferase [Desulfonatronovibrio hydrogenovorans]